MCDCTTDADIKTLLGEVQEKKVSAATLKARKEELERRLAELKAECTSTLGVDPDGLDAEAARLERIIGEKLSEVRKLLSGDAQ